MKLNWTYVFFITTILSLAWGITKGMECGIK